MRETEFVSLNRKVAWDSIRYFFDGYLYWTVTLITEKEDLEQAYRLRGRFFGEVLKWIDTDTEKGDVDKYDSGAIHFGVFEKRNLIAYSRLIPGTQQFMLEDDLIEMINGVEIRKGNNIAEISRLVIAENLSRSLKGNIAQAFLYRKMYRWAVEKGIQYWYIVVTPKYFEKLAEYFGFEQIAPTHTFGNGDSAVVGLLNLRQAERHLKKNNWLALKWYSGIFA